MEKDLGCVINSDVRKYNAGKYEVVGIIRNKDTGKILEEDIPLFLLLGTDRHIGHTLAHYFQACLNENHSQEGFDVIQAFLAWQRSNPDKIREPDTRE
jgi:hypothetical protein